MTNDWVYYDKVWQPGSIPEPSGIIGDYAWAINGMTDLPMLHGHNGLQRDDVTDALRAFEDLIHTLRDLVGRKPEVYAESGEPAPLADQTRCWDFLGKAARHDREQLQRIADRLHEIHGRMMVLPPDTLRVDYRTLPIKLMDGCTNACGFCMVRGDSSFAVRSTTDIDRQIEAVAEVYGADLYNYNSVVFGECDALISPSLEYAAAKAFDVFRCGASYHCGSNLFLFATNRTLCQKPDSTFDMLEALPFEKVWINVGWEAATDAAGSRKWRSRAISLRRMALNVRASWRLFAAPDTPGNCICPRFMADAAANRLCKTCVPFGAPISTSACIYIQCTVYNRNAPAVCTGDAHGNGRHEPLRASRFFAPRDGSNDPDSKPGRPADSPPCNRASIVRLDRMLPVKAA
jgi:hypothetical protein